MKNKNQVGVFFVGKTQFFHWIKMFKMASYIKVPSCQPGQSWKLNESTVLF